MKIAAFTILLAVLAAGCFTSKIVVEPTKSWEGHYMTEREFQDGTRNLSLDKNESVWVLSNSTMARLIKSNSK